MHHVSNCRAAICRVLVLAALAGASLAAASRETVAPAGRFDPQRLTRIDAIVADALAAGAAPGAVVLVGDTSGIVYRKAFGQRAIEPVAEPMTVETIFDAASLTKVLATTTAIMMMIEEGRARLNDSVARFIPECGKYGKSAITIRHLLTHMSGLRPDLDLSFPWRGSEEAIRLACEEVLLAPPGERLVYSDINFFLLGDIVRRVSGEPLDRFARERIFVPLGMQDTMFRPPDALLKRIAPTQWCTPYGWPCDGEPRALLRGVVHDPTARRMDGVAGHAGVFTTGDDLARFAQFLLSRGVSPGVRVLSPLAVDRMTSASTPPSEPDVRGLGWDIDSSFSSNRGELMLPGSFGHTGFTGTSIWIDPVSDLFVVFLSSRLHPAGAGDVTSLRAQVATAAAAALVDPPARIRQRYGGDRVPVRRPSEVPAASSPVQTGIDVLRAQTFAPLRGRRVGLVTNQTGRARDGVATIDLLHDAPGIALVALFSPEHGIRGVADAPVASSVDERTGLRVHSLYGETRRPTDAMLKGIEVLVIDLQDIGTRFYTYASTMAYALEEAAARGIEVMVLDRPNPIDGWHIEGPVADEGVRGFTAYFPMPVRHAMTMGELAGLFNGENRIGARLSVVPMQGWTREMWFDETGLPWVNPSPNMRNLIQAALYPGIGAFEWANISVGRGTDAPFEQLGAPWIDGPALAAALNARALDGVRFYPVTFVPASSKYAGETCEGVFAIVTDRDALRPVRVGLEVAAALHRLYPRQFDPGDTHRLFGSAEGLERLRRGESPEAIAASWASDEAKWRLLRAKYLLYK